LKSTPSGTGLPIFAQCMPIEITPATLKSKEKARKYHFNLSQSTFTPRKNSTDSLPFPGARAARAPAFNVFRCRAGSRRNKT
jgi:hypothetical protein